MVREQPEVRVRVPGPVKDWLKQQAERSRRSLTGEIAYRLEEAHKAEVKEAAGQTSSQA